MEYSLQSIMINIIILTPFVYDLNWKSDNHLINVVIFIDSKYSRDEGIDTVIS